MTVIVAGVEDELCVDQSVIVVVAEHDVFPGEIEQRHVSQVDHVVGIAVNLIAVVVQIVKRTVKERSEGDAQNPVDDGSSCIGIPTSGDYRTIPGTEDGTIGTGGRGQGATPTPTVVDVVVVEVVAVVVVTVIKVVVVIETVITVVTMVAIRTVAVGTAVASVIGLAATVVAVTAVAAAVSRLAVTALINVAATVAGLAAVAAVVDVAAAVSRLAGGTGGLVVNAAASALGAIILIQGARILDGLVATVS